MTEKPAAFSSRVKENFSWDMAQCFRLCMSMRAGLVLLVLLIVLSAAGTILWPNIYHTFGFQLIIGLLCLNTLLCSGKRLPALWRETFGALWFCPALMQAWPVKRSQKIKTGAQQTVHIAETLLKHRGFRLHHQVEQHETRIYAVKGRLAPWGTLAVHVSLLLIIGGAVYGKFYGFTTDAVLPTGSIYTVNNYPGLKATVDLRLHRFTASYYPDGTVSDWLSDISVERDGKEILRRELRVNQPLNYEGIIIYQMSYGNLIQTQLLDRTGTVSREADLREREKLTVDESEGLAVQPLRTTSQGRIVYVIYHANQVAAWGTAQPGEYIPLGKDKGSVRFPAVVPYSGVQVKRDPGVIWVWGGFILMISGFFLSIYAPRRTQLWLTVTADGQDTLFSLGCRDDRNAPTVENVLTEVISWQDPNHQRRNC